MKDAVVTQERTAITQSDRRKAEWEGGKRKRAEKMQSLCMKC